MAETETTLKEINQKLTELYQKVVTQPNNAYPKRGYIRCPECGEEILMLPALRKMSEAIENHVKIHKELPAPTPILQQQTAMHIRLDLAQQVLQQASSINLF
jgi:hypothetical protein